MDTNELFLVEIIFITNEKSTYRLILRERSKGIFVSPPFRVQKEFPHIWSILYIHNT